MHLRTSAPGAKGPFQELGGVGVRGDYAVIKCFGLCQGQWHKTKFVPPHAQQLTHGGHYHILDSQRSQPGLHSLCKEPFTCIILFVRM